MSTSANLKAVEPEPVAAAPEPAKPAPAPAKSVMKRLNAGIDAARQILQEAGYRVVNGRLHYPPGVREQLQPF